MICHGCSGPGATRTPDLRIRSPALYPTELRARIIFLFHSWAFGRMSSLNKKQLYIKCIRMRACATEYTIVTRTIFRQGTLERLF